jgi:transposase
MKYEQFLEIYQAGPEAVYQLVSGIIETKMMFMDKVASLSQQVALQEERIKELEAQFKKNSRNSSKPPSSDEFIKPKSQRKKSGKPSGGQKGHKGDTLKMTNTPDNIVHHRVKTCQGCGHSLEEVQPQGVERRQVFDLPPLKIKITEHQTESKVCPYCGLKNKASFPEGVGLPVQYGDNLKAFLVYLNQYQMTPYKRAAELIQDVYGHRLSQGTLFNAIGAAYEALEPVEEEIINLLVGASVVHVDETGIRVLDQRQWLHVISTETLTYYAHHEKRGSKATDEIGILPRFKGVSVHDFWKPYFKYDCGHALCNAHHLRELTGILELNQQKWPQEMIELLLEIKATVDERKPTAS